MPDDPPIDDLLATPEAREPSPFAALEPAPDGARAPAADGGEPATGGRLDLVFDVPVNL